MQQSFTVCWYKSDGQGCSLLMDRNVFTQARVVQADKVVQMASEGQ